MIKLKNTDLYLNKKGTKQLLDTDIEEIKLRFYVILREHEDRIRELEKLSKQRIT